MAVTITKSKDSPQNVYSGWQKVRFAWTSDGSGDASETVKLAGQIKQLITKPDGVAAPSADYDITLLDSDSIDSLNGAGTNRHTANTEFAEPLVSSTTPVVVAGEYTFTVANAGDTKKGVAIMYLKT